MGGCSTEAEGLTGKSDQLQGRLAIKGFSSESTHSQNETQPNQYEGPTASCVTVCIPSLKAEESPAQWGWTPTAGTSLPTVSLHVGYWLPCFDYVAFPPGRFHISSTRPTRPQTSRRGFSNNKAIISNKYLDWWWRHSRQCEH